ncbi:CYTH and CHAD domain-containing protein [Actinomadura fibrosa]|uniref:CHAD domain-containing protein n=1 Tax=Actinomadura fibrosa TaxID=111802 RepID=A0ABW2XSK0_9ACTN|nr:CYTH and CHAD domain-containing protein [Actinomadura fibrosa]
MSGHVEVEHKYEIDDGHALPDLRGVRGLSGVGEPERHTLLARYYDTADLRLARHGVTLRRRTGGSDEGWHLKLPEAKGRRRELRRPAGEPTDAVPDDLAELVTAYVRERPLVAVVELRTDRTERALLTEGGAVAAELADDHVTGMRLDQDGGGVSTWRELEVEEIDGPPEVAAAVGDALLRSGARRSSAPSKLAVVLGDQTAGAERPAEARTAADVITGYVGTHTERILTYDPLVRLADHDDDSVHKMRTSIRRIRSVLRTHRRLLDRDVTDPLDAELKWLADALGEVRDREVLAARFRRQLADLPAAPSGPSATSAATMADDPVRPSVADEPNWLAALAVEERTARAELREVLRSPRYLALLDRLDALVAEPPVTEKAWRPARGQERKVVAKAWEKMISRYRDAAHLPEGPERDAALHRTRKSAKRLRYTAEAAAPVLGKQADRIAKRAKKVQEVLGEHQDRIVATRHLAGADLSSASAADGYALGAITVLQDRLTPLDDLPRTWKKAADPKPVKKL